MESIVHLLELLERGFTGGAFLTAVFTGVACVLYLLYRLFELMHPEEIREIDQLLSHRFYYISERGRVAYLILCLEETLRFYQQDITDWEGILQTLWSITSHPESNWINVWTDSVENLLPSVILSDRAAETRSEEMRTARHLYLQAGVSMIVINTILESAYTIICEWSPSTETHDPDALRLIDRSEETMEAFGVPLPSDEMLQSLWKQKDASFGEAFDGLQFSCLSIKKMEK